MSTTARIGTFAIGLLVAFGAAFGLGRAVGPLDDADPAPTHDRPSVTAPPDGSSGGDSAPSAPGAPAEHGSHP